MLCIFRKTKIDIINEKNARPNWSGILTTQQTRKDFLLSVATSASIITDYATFGINTRRFINCDWAINLIMIHDFGICLDTNRLRTGVASVRICVCNAFLGRFNIGHSVCVITNTVCESFGFTVYTTVGCNRTCGTTTARSRFGTTLSCRRGVRWCKRGLR